MTRDDTAATAPAAPAAKPAQVRRVTFRKDDFNWPLGIGLGLNMTWVGMLFKSVQLYVTSAGLGGNSESLLDAAYLISIISLIVTFMFTAHFYAVSTRVTEKGLFKVLIPLGVSVSTAVLACAGLPGAAGRLCVWIGGITSGVFSALFLLMWGLACSKLTLKKNFIVAVMSYVFSGFFLVAFGYAPIYLGALATAVGIVLLPLLSLIFLVWGEQLIAAAVGIEQGDKPNILHSAAIEKVPLAESIGSREGRFFFEDKRSVYGLFVIIILWGLLNELSRTIYVKNGLVAGGESGFAIANNLSALIVTLLLLFLVVLLIAYPKRSNLVNVYRVALIVSVSSACLMPLVVVGGQAVFLPYAINTAAFRIFGCLMWVVITAVCTPERERTTQVFSWARACWAFGPLLGLLIGRWLFRVGASSDTGTIIVLAWILSVGYICGYLFAYNEEQVVKLTDFFPAAPRTKQLNLRCQIISRKYGLSERESEILTYRAKGRSAAFIQEQLVLSYSTVSTHRQHIYQKLGIHSQQELLDLVDKTIVE